MNRASAGLGVSALAAALAFTIPARAQGAKVSAITAMSGHTLVGDPLAGGALHLSFPVDSELVGFVALERLVGRASRVGVPCAGLILLGTCSPEPLTDHVHLTTIAGNMLAADKRLWGGDIGVDLAWSPWPRLPVLFEAGVAVGGLTPLVVERTDDGYAPFEDSLDLIRLHVGLAWRRAGAR